MRVMPGILSQADVRYLHIVAAFVKKIGIEVNCDESAIARAKHKAGCFVLLSNAPVGGA